jgi:putative transposase insK for insertion sequence
MQLKGNFGNNAPMQGFFAVMKTDCFAVQGELMMDELMKQIEDYSGLTFKPVRHCLALPYYLYCLQLRRLVLI